MEKKSLQLGIKKAFTNIADIFHLTIGFVIKYCEHIGLKLLATALLILYIVYQAVQKEPSIESYKDYIEMILGYILGEVVL